jgi:uncharacterized OsmC-like protein
MGDPATYTARARIVNHKSTSRDMFLPGLDEPIPVGFHPELARIYNIAEGTYEHSPGTYDYLVAAVGGCLTGVLSAMLEGRGIPTGGGRLTTDVTGDSEWEERVLRVKTIHCRYTLRASSNCDQGVIMRVHDMHAARCSMARSIRGAIDLMTSIDIVEE